MTLQCTAERSVACSGPSLHRGRRVNLRIEPAPKNTGLVFIREDLPGRPRIPVRPENVVDTQLATTLGADGVRVATVEHALAAIYGLGFDNLFLRIDGDELPATDGSSLPFVKLLRRAGRRVQRAGRPVITMLDTVEVRAGRSRATLSPAPAPSLRCEIEFAHPCIGRQAIDLPIDARRFARELAPARTFGFLEEVQALHASGLGLGGTLDNCVVLDDAGVLNPGGLRFPDEFVRHKALDALGDLAVLGHPIRGRLVTHEGGHALNQRLVQALLDRPEAWRLDVPSASQVAEYDAA